MSGHRKDLFPWSTVAQLVLEDKARCHNPRERDFSLMWIASGPHPGRAKLNIRFVVDDSVGCGEDRMSRGVTVTAAEGMTEPDGSVTIPDIVPRP